MSDEQWTDMLGCSGHPAVTNPHLVMLARRNTGFTKIYTPSPTYLPARAVIATGRHIHKTGYWDADRDAKITALEGKGN